MSTPGEDLLILLGPTDALSPSFMRRARVAVLSPEFSLADILRADLPIRVDLQNEEEVREQLRSLSEQYRIVGLMAFNDTLVRLAGRMTEWLALESLGRKDWLNRCINKAEMRNALAATPDLAVPFCRALSLTELEKAVDKLGLPCIIKPVAGTNSKFVQYCKSRQVALKAGQRILDAEGEVLVEPFLAGPEFSVDCATVDGKTTVLAVCEKILGPLPYFVEIGHHLPTLQTREVEERIVATAQRGLAVLGVDRAVTHTEIRLTESGPKILEINPRPAGGQMREFIRTITGYDLHEASLRAEFGEPPSRERPRVTHGIYHCLTAGEEGLVDYDTAYLPRPLGAGIVPLVELTVKPSERVYPVNHPKGKILGRILSYGQNFEQARSEIDKILLELQFRIISAPTPGPAADASQPTRQSSPRKGCACCSTSEPPPASVASPGTISGPEAEDTSRECKSSCCGDQVPLSEDSGEGLPEPAGAWSHVCC
jgi:hypothetical protein